MATVTIPEQIERLCGARVDSEEFVSRSDRQLRLILAHLAGSRPEGARGRPPDNSGRAGLTKVTQSGKTAAVVRRRVTGRHGSARLDRVGDPAKASLLLAVSCESRHEE